MAMHTEPEEKQALKNIRIPFIIWKRIGFLSWNIGF
jgi:hypothetical protein